MLEVIVEVVALKGFPRSCQKYIWGAFRTTVYTLIVEVDGKTILTCDFPEKGRQSNAKNKFGCNMSKASSIKFKVKCKHNGWIGSHEMSVAEINDIIHKLNLNEESKVNLKYMSKKKSRSGVLLLNVSRVSTTEELVQFKFPSLTKSLCSYTVDDLQSLGVVSQTLKSEACLECPEWVNVLGSLGTLLKIVQPISEVNPYSKLTLSVVQAAFEIFLKQREQDERVLNLVQVIGNLYQMILDSDPLVKCQTLSQSINELLTLTRECAYFIAQYCRMGAFVERAITNTLSNADDLIKQFEQQFFLLKEVFFTGIMLSIGQVTVRVLERLDAIDDKLDEIIDKITLPVIGRSWNKLEVCLGGTQEPILSEIYEWGSSCSDEDPNIFLLLGESRSAKTTISNTVASFFHKQGRLGATIFFDSDHSSCRNIFASIIRELLTYDPSMRHVVMAGLKGHPKFVNNHPNAQFDFLATEVFKRVTMIGPTVIVMDGLDSCTDWMAWNLHKLLVKFPSNIRLFITSKPTPDIVESFPEWKCVLRRMTDIEDDDKWGSLGLYVSGFLAVLEQKRPNLFLLHSCDVVDKQIHAIIFESDNLGRAILEFIAISEDDLATKFINLLVSQRPPRNEGQARELVKLCIYSNITSENLENLERVPEPLLDSIKLLVQHEYIQQAAYMAVRLPNYSAIVLDSDPLLHVSKGLRCSPGNCKVYNGIQVASSIKQIERFVQLFDGCVSAALHCILTCKCSYPPEAIKPENQTILEYLLTKHRAKCSHEAPPVGISTIAWALKTHHTVLDKYVTPYCDVPTQEYHIVCITPPLQHSGSSGESSEKITLLQIHPMISSFGDMRLEAVIYRAITDQGKEVLSQMREKLEGSLHGIEPYYKSMKTGDIEVVKNLHTRKASWFVNNGHNTDGHRKGEAVVWFNCSTSTEHGISEETEAGGRGIGFVSCLIPGDCIAITAKSKSVYCCVSTTITLYADSNERCFS